MSASESLVASEISLPSSGRTETILGDLTNPRWAETWRSLWNTKQDRRALIDEAVAWLRQKRIDSPDFSGVLLTALNSDRTNAALRQIGELWLRESSPNQADWGDIWLLMNTRRSGTVDSIGFMADEGVRFLDATVELADRNSVRLWSQVWNRLRNRARLRPKLVELARRTANEFSYHNAYLLNVLSHQASEPFARERLLDWLQHDGSPTEAWADAYVRLVQNGSVTAHIEQLGTEWLHKNRNINRWKRVWTALMNNAQDKRGLVELARNWLDHAYPDLKVWPEVMVAVLESGYSSAEEVDLAKQWIASHQNRAETRAFEELTEALLSNHAMI